MTEDSPTGALVERIIAFNALSTSRKTALLAGVWIPSLILTNLVAGHVLLSPLDWVDMRWYDGVLGGWLLQSLIAGAVAWRVAARGHEGRWTFYFNAITYTCFAAVFVYAFGLSSSAVLVVLPVSVMTVMVAYDDRIGRVVLAIGSLGIVLAFAVTATGWLTYAPAITDPDLDLQGSARYALAMALVTGVMCVSGFFLLYVVTAAARRTTTQLDEAHRKLGDASRLIASYVPAEVAADILEGRTHAGEAPERRRITVFFSDLVGFSDIAEELEPEDLATVLNEYFAEMTAIAHRHHGTVDELQGDALLIFFGAPHATNDREHALNAVHMASEMHASMKRLNRRWRDAGITETLEVRMGVNTGVVTIGNFGTPERMKYAALGKHVNIAARLQAVCEPGRTVLSYSTYLLVKDEIPCTALGPLQLKGIHKPVEAFRVA
jgi:class 3 adenylate cyclase